MRHQTGRLFRANWFLGGAVYDDDELLLPAGGFHHKVEVSVVPCYLLSPKPPSLVIPAALLTQGGFGFGDAYPRAADTAWFTPPPKLTESYLQPSKIRGQTGRIEPCRVYRAFL